MKLFFATIFIAATALFFFTARAEASGFTFVQSAQSTHGTIDYGSAVAKGDLLILLAGVKGGSDFVTGVTDTVGNTWYDAGAQSPNNTSINEQGQIFYAIANGDNTPDLTLSFNSGSNTNGTQLQVFEFSGDTGMSFTLDATSTAEEDTSNPSTSITASASGELIVGYLLSSAGVTTGPDYTTGLAGASWWNENSEYNLSGASGAQNVDWTSGANSWSLTLAAFREVVPIARVQYGHTYPGNSVTLTGTTAGDFLIAAVAANSISTSATCSDGVNSWTALTTVTNSVETSNLVIAYAPDIAGGDVTVTCTSMSDIGVTVAEYSGVATSSPIDTYATSTGGGTNDPVTVGPITLQSAGEGVFAAWNNETPNRNPGTWNAPYELIHTDTGHYDSQADYLNTAGSTTSASMALSQDRWDLVMVAFKSAGTTPPPPPASPVTMFARAIINATKVILNGVHLIIK